MSHSYVSCLVHVVFSTAERRPFIRDEIRERLHGYLSGTARKNEIQVLAVGGTADHVHLFDFSAADDLHCEGGSAIKAGVFQVDSRDVSGLLRMAGRVWSLFGWRLAKERRILSQIEHHQRISFEDELKKFLSIHGIDEDSSRP